MHGMSIAGLKKHKALIPLYVCTALGVVGAGFYTLRLATRNPDVQWTRKGGNVSNQDFADQQYKFYSPNIDYTKLDKPPKY